MTTVLLTHDRESLKLYYGDRALAGLRDAGVELRLNDSDQPLFGSRLIEAADGVEIIVSYRASPADAAVFAALPKLAAFMRCAVDIRNIDVRAASDHGILVTRASPGFAASVSELVLGQMIDLARNITFAAEAYHRGEVPKAVMGTQLAGSTVGILGYGEIGRRLAVITQALGMTVIVNDPFKDVDDPEVTAVSKEELLERADFVVCLVVANEQTENFIDQAAFARMKPNAFFINPSRGNLVDESALEAVLQTGSIAGCAMDVGRAPDQMPSPHLAKLPNVIATPHVGGLTPAAIEAQSLETVEQVKALLKGRLPHHAVNAEAAWRLKTFNIA